MSDTLTLRDVLRLDEPFRIRDTDIILLPRHDSPALLEALTSFDVLCNVPCATQRRRGDGVIAPPSTTAGISYTILDTGLAADVVRVFGLSRLHGIAQLGMLFPPRGNIEVKYPGSQLSQGDRFLHSTDVYVICMIIAHNVGLPESERNTLGLVALTHDGLSIAGGDSVKAMDPERFDEDMHYASFIESLGERFRDLAQKYNIDVRALLEAIHNRGLIGLILDIADKIAYVGRDTSLCHHHAVAAYHEGQQTLGELLDILETTPYVAGVWDCVRASGDRAYFTDIDRLERFLRVRMLMFREMYYHPETRYGEFFASRLFVKHLYTTGVISAEDLFRHDDSWLRMQIEQALGDYVLRPQSLQDVRITSFKTLDEAQIFVRTKRSEGIRLILIDNMRFIKIGAGMLVERDGVVATLSQSYPEIARTLDTDANSNPLVHVYWFEREPDLAPRILDALAESIRED